jgi:Methyltransferase domain
MDESGEIANSIKSFFGLAQMPHDGADLGKVEKLAAAIDSANYLNSRMAGCQRLPNPDALLTLAMSQRTVTDGLLLEFGVYSGRTINHLASLESGKLYGFDSFKGLPEDWRSEFRAGAFKLQNAPAVATNVELVVGWFEDTLPGFLKAHVGPVSFLHVDCDLYSSTKTVFHYLGGRIQPGTIIVFDEYFNYVGWRNHEFKAFAEFTEASGLGYRYIGAVPSLQQVAVLIL